MRATRLPGARAGRGRGGHAPRADGGIDRRVWQTHDAVRLAVKRDGQVMAAMQIFEMLTMVSAMKMSLPRLPPAAPLASAWASWRAPTE